MNRGEVTLLIALDISAAFDTVIHSTLLRTLDAAYKAMDRGEATLLVSLDISAAFDTVVHSTLVQRLHSSFGVDGNILTWITSYLSERSQFVKVGSASPPPLPSNCSCGAPQGPVLGPLFFTIYIWPVTNVVESFGVYQQQYADDTQLYIELSPNTLEIAIRENRGLCRGPATLVCAKWTCSEPR